LHCAENPTRSCANHKGSQTKRREAREQESVRQRIEMKT